ncbi:hypothetical protein [Amycolatopsis keratiniphila]|uniref:DUF732 domain-containing protein n=1 Tax=Amycolatopsis keratiniphila TaxID=129921 RepID=R4TKE3_9PSEU|nr:hypothetical protein [Amycolatopsis keratiniphila]AGM10618.1 hypothetical protein AORI_8037 [Amycolatopsis keratiniphila]
MRARTIIATITVTCGVLLSGCSTAVSPPDPKAQWTAAMKSAGFVPNSPRTYDEMFEAAKNFCSAGSALAISGLARTVLTPEMADRTAMPARGKDPDTAAKAYGDATWKWACGHQ